MVVVVVLVDHSVVVVVVSWRGLLVGGRRPPGESAAILAWRLPLWNGGRFCADVCSRRRRVGGGRNLDMPSKLVIDLLKGVK